MQYFSAQKKAMDPEDGRVQENGRIEKKMKRGARQDK